MLEQENSRKDKRTGVCLVESGMLRSCTVSRFKESYFVVHVDTRGETQPTNRCSKGIREIITVQICHCKYRVFCGAKQYLLEHRVGYAVFYNNFTFGLHTKEICCKLLLSNANISKLLKCNLITPFPEASFGKFHYISLVDKCD